MLGPWFWSLVWEDPAGHGATSPCATTAEPALERELQVLSPSGTATEACTAACAPRGGHCSEKPVQDQTAAPTPQLKTACTQQQTSAVTGQLKNLKTIAWINIKALLSNTGNHIQYPMINHNGKYIHVLLNQFAIHHH